MLSPEVLNFAPPKVYESKKVHQSFESVKKTLNLNSCYSSAIITCPDELQTPKFLQEFLSHNSTYYTLTSVRLTEFLETEFIDAFIKQGNTFCLSMNTHCILQNCVTITPDGILILHVMTHVYQTLGFDGKSRPYGYYEVKIDLKSKNLERYQQGLFELGLFDLYLKWEPECDSICPELVEKYFINRNIRISAHSMDIKNILPKITEVPSVLDVDIEEMTEWIGMLAHQADVNPTESYISCYSQPESELALKTSRISVCIVKGFLSKTFVRKLCVKLNEYVMSRMIDDYWSALSVQSFEHSRWQFNTSSPPMFQAQDSSCNVFLTCQNHMEHCIGQLHYS